MMHIASGFSRTRQGSQKIKGPVKPDATDNEPLC
jgi:hypothetical protein